MKSLFILCVASFLINGCCSNSTSPKMANSDLQQGENFLQMIGYSKEDKSYLLLKNALQFYFSTSPDLTATEVKSADAIFAFAFGQGDGDPPTPGGSNEGLAEICKQLYNLSGDKLPIYAQWEIADVLQEQYQISTTCKAVVRGEYLSTIGVLDQFMEYDSIHHKEIKTVLVVAQKDHAFRAIKLVEKQGFKVLSGNNCFEPNTGWKQYDCDNWGYFQKSSQPWTTNRGNFITHELYWVNVAYLKGSIDN